MQATKTWQIQEAKTHFSEMIKQTAFAPQPITMRGKPVAVVISIAKYKQLTKPKRKLIDALCSAPFCLDCLELPERKAEELREITFE
jgi:prevent-host-death family protein